MYGILLVLGSVLALYTGEIIQSRVAYFIVLNTWSVAEYTLIVLFLYYLLHNKKLKKIFLFSIIPFWVFAFVIFFKSTNNSVSEPSGTVILIYFTACIIALFCYFVEKVKHVSKTPSYTTISFWLCVGLLTYFSGNFFVFTLRIFKPQSVLVDLEPQLLLIYSFITIVKDIILSLAWLVQEPKENDTDIISMPTSIVIDFDKQFEDIRNKNSTTN